MIHSRISNQLPLSQCTNVVWYQDRDPLYGSEQGNGLEPQEAFWTSAEATTKNSGERGDFECFPVTY